MTDNPIIDALRASLESVPAHAPLLVGFSGGVDSQVLLHGLRRIHPASGRRELRAVHVHHGLHPSADAWQSHCESVCSGLGVSLEVIRVDVSDVGAQGPEAAARQSRYDAFAGALRANEILCLAHHLDDQAETFLLQLLRGAGPKGLSGMPPRTAFASGELLRPLLQVPRSAILEYAAACGLDWVEDSSNADERFDRNYLRHRIFPLLQARWPGAARTIARAAAHQAALARTEEALGDALSAAAGDHSDTLDCATLAGIDRGAAALAVRAWLTRQGFTPPSAKLMDRIFNEVMGAADDAGPLVAWKGVEVRRYRGRLFAIAPRPRPDAEAATPWNVGEPLEFSHGRLEATPVTGAGLDAKRCTQDQVEVRFRCGGERCRPAGQAQSSPLKYWFQQRGIPPWERDRIPLIYVGTELAAVAGVWVCAGFEPDPDSPGWVLHWRPRGSPVAGGGV